MIQAADEDDGTKNPRPKSSKTIPAVLRAIWKRQRILSFFKGLHAQTVLSSALLLMIKEKISAIQAAEKDYGKTKNHRPKSSKTIPAVLCAIWKREGILGFFKGLRAQIFKTVLSSALFLMIKEKISAIQAADEDYGKTKNPRPKSSKTTPAVLCAIWKREGILGFFKGLRAQILKTVLSSALRVLLLSIGRSLLLTRGRLKSACFQLCRQEFAEFTCKLGGSLIYLPETDVPFEFGVLRPPPTDPARKARTVAIKQFCLLEERNGSGLASMMVALSICWGLVLRVTLLFREIM